MIKTHKNSDGTYDASINGVRLGLHCIFAVSARVTAKVVLTKSLARQVRKVSVYDSRTLQYSVVPLSQFVDAISRKGFSFSMDRSSAAANAAMGGRGTSGWVVFKEWQYTGEYYTFEMKVNASVYSLTPLFGF